MRRKQIQWINTPVITEAIFRYEKGLLPNSMKLWLEQVLEIESKKSIKQFEIKFNNNQDAKILKAAIAAP